MKKIIALFLLVVMSVVCLSSCGKKSGGTASDTGGGEATFTDSRLSTDKVNFVDADNESVYRIVRPEGDADLTATAGGLFKKMKETLGVAVKNIDDTADGTDAYEILVGHTNRPESQQALDILVDKASGRYDDYIICTVGKKIVINAQSLDGIKAGCDRFAEKFLKLEGVPGGIAYIFEVQGDFESITVNKTNIGRFTIVRPLYNSSYLTQKEMETMVDTVYKKTGYMLNIAYDTAAESEYEIVVGNADRNSVEYVNNYDDWSVKVAGKKVYLNGGSAHSTAMAVTEFVKLLKGDVADSASVTGSYETAVAMLDKATTYKHVWGDDFDGDKIDATKWWHIGENGWKSEGLNGKTSVRSSNPDDVYVADGNFYICAREDDSFYYGGMLRTQITMTYKYGYIEMSALLPHGDGFWVALWQMTASEKAEIDAEPEIDIVECFGNTASYAVNAHSWPTETGTALGWIHTSLDGGKYANDKKYSLKDTAAKLGDGMHTYGMLWTDKAMSFTCDGEIFFTYDTTETDQRVATFNQAQYLIISMATGFKNSGAGITSNPDDWQFTNKLVIDWLHIYQPDDGLHELNILS